MRGELNRGLSGLPGEFEMSHLVKTSAGTTPGDFDARRIDTAMSWPIGASGTEKRRKYKTATSYDLVGGLSEIRTFLSAMRFGDYVALGSKTFLGSFRVRF